MRERSHRRSESNRRVRDEGGLIDGVDLIGDVSHSASSPGGCTVWWAYSNTVGRPAGELAGEDRSRGISDGDQADVESFVGEQGGNGFGRPPLSAACSGSKLTLGILTSASRSARTEVASFG